VDQKIQEKFPQCAALVRDAVTEHRRRYRRQARRYFVWFRLVGTVEIFLSLSLPVIVLVGATTLAAGTGANGQGTTGGSTSDLVIVVVSILIALATALQNFFRWHENWQLFSSQGLSLDSLVTEWRFEMIKLIDGEPAGSVSDALEKTGAFLQALSQSLRSEHETFADAVSSPEVPRLGHTAAPGG
jgi:hypothetical protein